MNIVGNEDIIRSLQKLEANTIKLREETTLPRLFKDCLSNWRFLVHTGNKKELTRKTKLFCNAIKHRVNPQSFGVKRALGTKDKKNKYLRILENYLDSLEKWETDQITEKKVV